MSGCPRGVLLSAVLLMGLVGCDTPPDSEKSQSLERVTLQGLSSDPDFVVTKVTAPSSATPGSTFQTTVEVCNRGGSGNSVNVGLYFSADNVIAPTDFWATSLYVGYLPTGQCQSQTVSVTASVPTNGPWFLGAYADPYGSVFESNEGNNGLASPVMGIGYGPDFAVMSVTGPASSQMGQPITAQVTVCNRGTQSGSTDVQVYLSADDAIHANGPSGPSEDSFVGSAPTGYLYPNQCATVPVNGYAYVPPPGMEGPYYVGAVVNANGSQPELIASNNALAGYRMGVGLKAEFVVTAVTGPASAQNGQSIATQVTVCNRGTQGDSTDVEVYLSADDAIHANGPSGPSEDSFVGSAPVGYLNPSQCATVPVNGYAYTPPPGMEGPYYVGAVVDPHGSRAELIEDNNALAGYRIGVGFKAEFVVTAVTGPASAQMGQSITTQVTVCNRGTQGDSTDVEVYLSADSAIHANVPPGPPEDSLVGSGYTGYLNPNQCATVPVNGYAYVPPPGMEGPYYVGAVVDPHNNRPELIEDNNSLAGYRMGVGLKAEFVVTAVTGPASAQMGQTITTQVTVCNRGTQGDSTDVEVYLSTDDAIHAYTYPGPPEDSMVGSGYTGYLNPNQCATVPVSGSAYAPPPGSDGPYYVGAVVDPRGTRPELIEDNNSLAGYRMGLGFKAEFVVTAVTGPASAQMGQSITTQVTVCNRGTQGDSTDVEVYLSADSAIHTNVPPGPPEDFFVGSAPVGYLNPNQCATVPVSGSAYAPPPGAEGPYYVGAVVDPHNNRPELIEDNNSLAGYRMGLGKKPDFVITTVTGPYSAQLGSSFSVSVGVCNRGQLTDTVDVELYLSADTNVQVPSPPGPPADFFLGSVTGIPLAAGACTTRSLSVTMPTVPEGAYYLGAVADPHGTRPELIEDNNATAGNVIGAGSKADFVVTTVSGPASIKLGTAFTASVTVCNYGQMADTTDVDLYFSADSNIRVPAAPTPPEDFYLGRLTGVSLGIGVCATRAIVLNAYAPTTGSYYLGAVSDAANVRPELIEDNNTKAGTYMAVTP